MLASWALGHSLECAARNSPTTHAKTGRKAQVFTAQGGRGPKITIRDEYFTKVILSELYQLGVLSHTLKCEMKSLRLVDRS